MAGQEDVDDINLQVARFGAKQTLTPQRCWNSAVVCDLRVQLQTSPRST